MAFIFGKGKKEKERDRLFRRVQDAAAISDMGQLSSALLDLYAQKELLKDPELPFLLDSAVTNMTKKSVADGLHMVIWSLNYFHSTEAQSNLVAKAFALTERVDRKNMDQLASVAMTMMGVSGLPILNIGALERARHEWLSAVDDLAANKSGLQFAFAAASNAAIGREPRRLRKDAIQKWDDIVINMAKTDRRGALVEAFRMADGYKDFGADAAEIRARADSVLKRLQTMGR